MRIDAHAINQTISRQDRQRKASTERDGTLTNAATIVVNTYVPHVQIFLHNLASKEY